MAASFSIREARRPDDEPLMIRYINALQRFEHAFEPNRRIDAHSGADYLPELLKRVDAMNGRIFIAETDGRPVGWGVFHTQDNMLFVVEEERRHGYIAELFVIEEMRSRGIGRALIAACEDAARALSLRLVMIGVLVGNTRARKAYEAAGFKPYAVELRKYL